MKKAYDIAEYDENTYTIYNDMLLTQNVVVSFRIDGDILDLGTVTGLTKQ